jgi:hypothetical protein
MRCFGFAAGVFFVYILAGCASAPVDREVSDEEMVLPEWYLDSLKFMIYFREDSEEEFRLKDAALRAAQKYALARGVALTENAEEAGVYLELDAASEGESGHENHYGAAVVQCTIIEALTGVRLGVLRKPSARTFSKASQFDARANAVQSVLEGMVAQAVAETRGFLVDLYSGGRKSREGGLFLNEVTNRILNPKK